MQTAWVSETSETFCTASGSLVTLRGKHKLNIKVTRDGNANDKVPLLCRALCDLGYSSVAGHGPEPVQVLWWQAAV